MQVGISFDSCLNIEIRYNGIPGQRQFIIPGRKIYRRLPPFSIERQTFWEYCIDLKYRKFI